MNRLRSLPLLLVALSSWAHAQEPRTNLAYLQNFGTGGYDVGGQTLRALRVPLSFDLREMEGKRTGFRLRIPVTVRITDINLGAIEFNDLKAIMVVPRLEAHIPLSREWILKPFIGWGVAWEVDLEKGVWVGTGGLQGEWLRDRDPWECFFGARAAYNLSVDFDESNFQDIGSLDSRLETRYRVGGNVSGHHWQPGLYGQVFYYWDGARFDVPGVVSTVLDLEYEIGFSIATKPKLPILGFRIPRISLGYRFGDGLKGVRLSFGEY